MKLKIVERSSGRGRLRNGTIALMAKRQDDPYPTRSSLLRRVKDTEDQRSWQEFNDIYGKLVLGFALKAGLTEDEAQEVVQETMIAAAKHLPQFRYDPKVCAFKTWLLNLSAWRVRDQLRKRRAPSAPKAASAPASLADDSSRTATVERVPDPSADGLESIWDEEWRTTLLNAALARVRARVEAKQWQMFDLCARQEWPVREVAEALGVSAGQVYVVKYRISAMVKKELRKGERFI